MYNKASRAAFLCMIGATLCTINAYTRLLNGEVPVRLRDTPAIYSCAPEWSWKPAPLVDYDLWCVLKGCGTMHLQSGVQKLTPGTCCIVPPGAAPHATHDPSCPLSVFAIHFDCDRAFTPPSDILIQHVQDIALLCMLAERAVTPPSRRGEYRDRQMLSLVYEIMLLMLVEGERRDACPYESQITEILAEVRANPEKPWTVALMASRAFLSRSQFTRLVHREMNLSPMDYVIKLRLEAARRLLIETAWTVAQIAFETGYTDAQYFSRQFRKRFGQSPTQYRHTAM